MDAIAERWQQGLGRVGRGQGVRGREAHLPGAAVGQLGQRSAQLLALVAGQYRQVVVIADPVHGQHAEQVVLIDASHQQREGRPLGLVRHQLLEQAGPHFLVGRRQVAVDGGADDSAAGALHRHDGHVVLQLQPDDLAQRRVRGALGQQLQHPVHRFAAEKVSFRERYLFPTTADRTKTKTPPAPANGTARYRLGQVKTG